MSSTDFSKALGGTRADMAVFSTFDFDPLYFENRPLRSTALEKARRILVFMDGSRYDQLASQDVHARYVNERYLLVPVRPGTGAFHPKLHLLLNKQQTTIFCGSNNMTQAGCTTNLELTNIVTVAKELEDERSRGLLSDVMEFYLRCCDMADPLLAETARKWLNEVIFDNPWLRTQDAERITPWFAETTEGPLWESVNEALASRQPDRILVISPFFDHDLRLLSDVQKRWGCPVEICAQEQTSNLPAEALNSFDEVELYSLKSSNSRRLHAKLMAFDLKTCWLCVAGSANFTSAAFEGQNIETCLIFEVTAAALNDLFGDDVQRTRIKPTEFEPAVRCDDTSQHKPMLRLRSVVLRDSGAVEIDVHEDEADWAEMKVEFRSYSEQRTSLSKPLLDKDGQWVPVVLTEDEVKGFRGSVICRLRGRGLDGVGLQSNSAWLVQPAKLTREFGSGNSQSGRERTVLETGRGAVELIEAKIKQEGVEAAIRYLNHLNIRFHAETKKSLNQRGLGVGIHDPTLPDTRTVYTKEEKGALSQAVEDFVDRHHRKVLGKHAASGNVNGLTNFMDVMVECNKFLFTNYRKGVLKVFRAMEGILRANGIMGTGYTFPGQKSFPGYLSVMIERQGGEHDTIREAFEEVMGMEHAAIGLAMAQIMKWGRAKSGAPQEQLAAEAGKLESMADLIGGWTPDADTIRRVIGDYAAVSVNDRDLIANTVLKTAPSKEPSA